MSKPDLRSKYSAFLSGNLIAVIFFFIIGLLIVSTLGYFDEGNYLHYSSVWDYINRGLALNDLAGATIAVVVMGIIIFNTLTLIPRLKNKIIFRLLFSISLIPVGMLIGISVIFIMLNVIK